MCKSVNRFFGLTNVVQGIEIVYKIVYRPDKSRGYYHFNPRRIFIVGYKAVIYDGLFKRLRASVLNQFDLMPSNICICYFFLLSDVPPNFRSAYFSMLYKGSFIGNPNPLSTERATSLLRCAGYCTRSPQCVSFDFASGQRQCHLYDLTSTDIEPSPDSDFSVYTKY